MSRLLVLEAASEVAKAVVVVVVAVVEKKPQEELEKAKAKGNIELGILVWLIPMLSYPSYLVDYQVKALYGVNIKEGEHL